MHQYIRKRTREDCPKTPCNRDGTSKITFRRAESVRNARALEEEQRKEDENLGNDARTVLVRVHAERLEASDDDKDDGPAVVQAEWQVNEDCMR